MLAQFLQFLFSGITVGATYALAALGFTLIYNASNVINFAQGEFIMLGGMLAVFFTQMGLPLPVALLLAIVVPAIVGVLVEKLAIEPVKGAETVTLIIITIGASLVIRGLTAVIFGKGTHSMPAFSGDAPIEVLGATLLPQSLWVLGVTALVVVALWYFFNRTLQGKAMLATSYNRLAAELVGINTSWVLFMSFAMSAALGALGGILITPITLTFLRCRHHARLERLRRGGRRRSGQRPGRRGRRPAGRHPGSDGGRLHFVGLQGCDSLRVDPVHSLLHAARPVWRQIDGSGVSMKKSVYNGLYLVIAILLVLPSCCPTAFTSTSRCAWRSTP